MSRSVLTLGVLLLMEVRGGAFTRTADVRVHGDAMAAFLAQARTLYDRFDGRGS